MSPRQGARLVVRHSSFDHPKCALSAFIAGHPLNYALEIIQPGLLNHSADSSHLNVAEAPFEPGHKASTCTPDAAGVTPSTGAPWHESAPDDILKAVLQRIASREYILVRCNLACLVEHDFVERHIRAEAASFCAISVDTRAGNTNSVAIVPDGKLHLAVSADTYHRLGLQGAHIPHNPGRYHIEVNLFGRSYEPGAPFYSKVMSRLMEHTGPLDLLCVKTIDGAAADIQSPAGTEILSTRKMCPVLSKTQVWSCAPPALTAAALDRDGQAQLQGAAVREASVEDQLAIYEWLGGLSCGILGDEAYRHSAPEGPSRELVTRLTYSGLLPSCSAIDAVQAARQQVNETDCAWAAVHVWGFQHAPVSWHGACHGHGPVLGGENDYTVLLLPGDQYVLYVAAGEGDQFSGIGPPGNAA